LNWPRTKKGSSQEQIIVCTKKNSLGIPDKQKLVCCINYQNLPNTMIFPDGGNRFQLIGTVYALFHFKKQKKWKTYIQAI
jgi:hypothetical protein